MADGANGWRGDVLFVKVGAWLILGLQIGGASVLWAHTSDAPTILGRYSPGFFGLVVAYHLMMLAWAWLTARLTSRHGVTSVAETLTDLFAAQRLLFEATLFGLWGVTFVYTIIGVSENIAPLVIVAPLATVAFATLVLLALSDWWKVPPDHSLTSRVGARPFLVTAAGVVLWTAMALFVRLRAADSAFPLVHILPVVCLACAIWLVAARRADLTILFETTVQASPGPITASPAWTRLRTTVGHVLRRDGLALALYVILTLVVTYPLVLRLGSAVPGYGRDIWPAIWEEWWLRRAIATGTDPTFTTWLLYPTGLDLTFAGRHWTALPIHAPLAALFGDATAYNLNSLLAILAGAYFAYLLALTLTGSRVAAWVGGVVFAFWPGHLVSFYGIPNTGRIQLMPLFILAFIHGLRTRKLAYMVLAAVTLALTGYYNAKTTLLTIYVGGLYLLGWVIATRAWRERQTWSSLVVFGAAFLLLIAPVVYPFVSAPAYVDTAIEEHGLVEGKYVDLRWFFVPALEKPWSAFYLGWSGIALAVVALWDMFRAKKQHLIWPAMTIALFSLSLGMVLQVASERYEWVPMPLRLAQHIPTVQAISQPFRFGLAASLPWAILVSYGVAALLSGKSYPRMRSWLVGGVISLLLFEYALVPVRVFPLSISPFHYEIASDGQSYAIIDLPMGTRRSKRYMLLQTIHGKPIVEGMEARMLPSAFDYIEAQPLLQAWNAKTALDCSQLDVPAAIDDLLSQGFRYVILHSVQSTQLTIKQRHEVALQTYFVDTEPIHEDQFVAVYDLRHLRDTHAACAPAAPDR